MAQLKDTVVQGSLRVTDTTYTTNLNISNITASKAILADENKNLTSGTVPIASGGTGLTSSPSMLVNLASTSAANVLQTSPRPGVTGTLGVANGGTGIQTATYKNAIITGNASTVTNAFQTIRTNNGAFYATAQDGTPSFGILPIAQGGTNLTSITANGVIYAASTTAYGCTAAGTANHIFIGAGASAAPVWTTSATLSSATSTTANTAAYDILTLGNSANVTTTTAHSEGKIYLYSAATHAHIIIGTSTTTEYTHTLPNNTGLLVSLSGGTAKGSGTKPVYIPNTGIVTECSTYAGGTAVTLNGSNKGASTATFYAPTTSGTTNQILISSGENNAPSWQATASGAAYATSSNGALTFGTLPVAQGGTNLTTITQGGIIYAASTTAYGCTAVGTSGYLLQSNGTGAPSWIQATDSNVASTIVKRNSSGNFSANIISSTLNGLIAYQSTLTKGQAPTGDVLRFTYCSTYESGTGREAANRIGGLVEGLIDTNGRAGLVLRAYQHTANSTVDNNLVLYCDTAGTATYSVSNAYNFCKAIGAPQIKTASFTSVTLNTSGYTYSDSWITADTAIVATDLQRLSLPGIVTWDISAGKIVFKCTVSASLSFSIMMLKPCNL